MAKDGESTKKAVGSNWSKLKTKVAANPSTKKKEAEAAVQQEVNSTDPFNTAKLSAKIKANYVGLDCEMVGIGPSGTQSALARCCLVDFDGEVIYDEFVRPPGFVTDFRTKWSGVRKKDLRQGTAISLQECQQAVANILKDKVLVGHALKNDLDVLMLSHPRTMIRDTATYRPYMRIHGKHGKVRPRALKDLTKEHLKMEIQAGEHDPGVDARCAVMLYRKARDTWEQHLKEIRTNAKAKAAATVTEKQQQQQQQVLQASDAHSTAAGGSAGSAHTKASSAGKKRADSITEELRREVYGAPEEEGADGECAAESDGEGSEGSASGDEDAAEAGDTHSTSTSKKAATDKSASKQSASDDLVVLRKVEAKPKSATKNKGTVSKADAVLSHVDIEVQVMDGGDGADTSISVKGKKRKLSKNGFITSHSMKHHSNEANKGVVTKKARLGAVEGAVPSTSGSGMFASSTASSSVASAVSSLASTSATKKIEHSSRSIFSGSVDLEAVGLGSSVHGSGKVRSIADVDRAMQKKQRAAKQGKK